MANHISVKLEMLLEAVHTSISYDWPYLLAQTIDFKQNVELLNRLINTTIQNSMII
jgi:hypothetical protein